IGLFMVSSAQAWTANTTDWWSGAYGTSAFQKIRASLSVVPSMAILMVVGGAMVGSLFSADAWNNITFTAGEIKHPRPNLPMSLFLGTGLVIVLYLLANVAYIRSLPVLGEDRLAKANQQEADHEYDRAKSLEKQGKPEAAADALSKADTRASTAAYYRGID